MRAVAFGLAILWIALCSSVAGEPVRVFAAASLKGALDDAAGAFTAQTKVQTSIAYAATSTIAKQIEQRAPADIFIAADREWMDYLGAKNLIDPASRVNILGNRLALIAPASSELQLKIEKGFMLAAALGDGRLSVADPDAVPAGKYAKAALVALGVWRSVEAKLARAGNVRAALALVAHAETPLGIVYATDAMAEAKVRVLDVFPAQSHPPIVYLAAKVKGARRGSDEFLAFLNGAEARGIFVRAGFLVP